MRSTALVPRVFAPPVALAALVGAAGCRGGGVVQPPARAAVHDSAVYVVRLGLDTSYIQWMVRDGRDVRMRVVERMPRVRVVHTTLAQNADGSVARLGRRAYLPGAADTMPVDVADVEATGDSTILVVGPPGEPRRVASAGRAHVLVGPLLMSSYPLLAPFAPTRVGDSLVSRMLSPTLGDRRLVIRRTAADTFTLASDLMGLVRVHVGARGRSNGFDALGSSINMVGTRVPWISFDSVVRAFVARERASGVAGVSSPRDTARATVGDAAVAVDYGRPARRGRVVFGGIVPWGRVWRTGANLATHLATDRALLVGGAELAPGRYTLFTLPEPHEWTLIVSRQTGQWGTDYDPSLDVARLPMQVVRIAGESVERFTIRVDPEGDGGVLRFQWDTVEARVPVRTMR